MTSVMTDLEIPRPIEEPLGIPVAPPSPRYFGLDGVRAAAMLLGVFYHLPIAMMAGGFGMGFGNFGGSPKVPIDNWLHSFRMPLFFLISGFFANMMLNKYGLRRYLTRRWWRIGAPLFLSLIVLAGLRISTEYFRPSPAPGFGPGNNPFANPFGAPSPGTAAARPANAAAGTPLSPMTPPPFGGPRDQAPDRPVNGARDGGPAPSATPPQQRSFGPGPFGPGTFGPGTFGPGTLGQTPFGPGPFGPPPGGQAPAGAAFGSPAPGRATVPMPRIQLPSRTWANAIFADRSRHVSLEHLWFLWYLLLFVTAGPLAVKLISLPWGRTPLAFLDRLGRGLLRWNLAPLCLALLTLPALVHAQGFMGWSLTNPIGFSAAFPDFLLQYFADEPYYFLYFLAGWWLFRMRAQLPDMAQHWLGSLVLGVIAFAISQRLASTYALRTDATYYQAIRWGSFALYGAGAAYSTCGFIGFFQKYLDRPTAVGRYFADTALWIYLAHLPLIPYLMWWVQPANSAWWTASLAGMVIVTGVALVLFELLIRPTPLVHIYGPPSPRRSAERQGIS